MWLHMPLSSGSFNPNTFACGYLRAHVCAQWWDAEGSRIEEMEEAKEFPGFKMAEYDAYKKELERIRELKALIENEEIMQERLLVMARSIFAPRRESLSIFCSLMRCKS